MRDTRTPGCRESHTWILTSVSCVHPRACTPTQAAVRTQRVCACAATGAHNAAIRRALCIPTPLPAACTTVSRQPSGCAAPGTEEPVRAGPRGTGCGVGHKLGFPCRFAAVRCSRDAGMGSASWPPSQPRSCGRSCRGPGSSAGHGAGQQPAPAPAPGRAEAAAQGPGGVSGTAAAGSSA